MVRTTTLRLVGRKFTSSLLPRHRIPVGVRAARRFKQGSVALGRPAVTVTNVYKNITLSNREIALVRSLLTERYQTLRDTECNNSLVEVEMGAEMHDITMALGRMALA